MDMLLRKFQMEGEGNFNSLVKGENNSRRQRWQETFFPLNLSSLLLIIHMCITNTHLFNMINLLTAGISSCSNFTPPAKGGKEKINLFHVCM